MDKHRIEISLDSGANCQSKRTETVSAEELGFDSFQHWKSASGEDKYRAVLEWFHGNGYPEISWKE